MMNDQPSWMTIVRPTLTISRQPPLGPRPAACHPRSMPLSTPRSQAVQAHCMAAHLIRKPVRQPRNADDGDEPAELHLQGGWRVERGGCWWAGAGESGGSMRLQGGAGAVRRIIRHWR